MRGRDAVNKPIMSSVRCLFLILFKCLNNAERSELDALEAAADGEYGQMVDF